MCLRKCTTYTHRIVSIGIKFADALLYFFKGFLANVSCRTCFSSLYLLIIVDTLNHLVELIWTCRSYVYFPIFRVEFFERCQLFQLCNQSLFLINGGEHNQSWQTAVGCCSLPRKGKTKCSSAA